MIQIKKSRMKEIMIYVNWAGHCLYDIAHERKNDVFTIFLINSIYLIFYMISHIRKKIDSLRCKKIFI